MSGKKEGSKGGKPGHDHRVARGWVRTVIKKENSFPGYTLMWSEWIEERGDNKEPGGRGSWFQGLDGRAICKKSE